jgi:DNA-binding protein HU-beta
MNKAELIRSISEKSGLNRKNSEKALAAIIDSVTDALIEGDKVQIIGFGIFDVKERPARTGRNPKTKEIIDIPATRSPMFKPGSLLRDAVAKG